MKKFILVVSIILFSTVADSRNFWEAQKAPAEGNSESIGTYSLGCMIVAQALPLDGYGWQVMRPSRGRYYARSETLDYIKNLAKHVRNDLKSTLMVGDLSLPKGGPFTYGHRSHQIGLDADLWFYTPPAANKRNLSRTEREKISAVSLVDHRKKQVNKNWKAYHRNLLKIAANNDKVDRIFVNAVIKRELCKIDKGAEWLGKIRPWLGHDYHFHVRLKCPKGDESCTYPKDYEPIKGDGCDETLDWWFKKPTKQEIEEWKKKETEKKKQPKPQLPLECQRLTIRK